MSSANLEQRIERLERIVEKLQSEFRRSPERDDWRSTVGMFSGDPIAKEIIDEALRLREQERQEMA
jgi:hypothetical protein